MLRDLLGHWNAYTGRIGPQIMPSGLNTDTPRALASLANLNGIQAGMLLPGHGDRGPAAWKTRSGAPAPQDRHDG